MLKAQGGSSGRTGTKILLEAMSKDKVHLARFVLDALDGEIVDSKTEDAQTPLIYSILLPDIHTRCKFVELLLQRGANVNRQDGDGRTALSYACERGYLDAVKILVRHNADPEIVDTWGNTALMYAAVAGHSPVVDFLVRAFKRLGLQIDRQNKVGNSAVEVAKFMGHTECIYALSNTSRRGREADSGAVGTAQPQRGDVTDRFNRKVAHLGNKLELLQVCDRTDYRNNVHQKDLKKQSRKPSMGSIDEFETESEGSSRPPQNVVFSRVATPKNQARTPDHSPDSKQSKTSQRLTTIDEHLPPLRQSCEAQKSIFFSPRLSRNPVKLSAPSALGVLMTPILVNQSENESEKTKTSDFGLRRFHDSYYQKRCSLPTSLLSPTPPERMLLPVRKPRTVTRREASPCKDGTHQFSTPAASVSTTTLSTLSDKLFRRFTSPEFRKHVKGLEENPLMASGRMPRSETFPQDIKHPQVGSKPSINSISSVKCEFDFHFRTPKS